MKVAGNYRMAAALCALVLALGVVGQGRIIYVDDDAVGAADGSSWVDAFPHLQGALAVARRADQIRVAQGMYKPDQGMAVGREGVREAVFELVSGVTLEGGYAGLAGEDPNGRDIDRYETILTGDLNGDDGPNFSNNGDNSRRGVVSSPGNDETTVLEGVTVVAGNSDEGAGIRCLDSDIRIRRCKIVRNRSRGHGAGLWVEQGHPVLVDCLFEGNEAAGHGDGLYAIGGSITLERCTFRGNGNFGQVVGRRGPGCSGGGMHVYPEGESLCIECRFVDNIASESGGGAYVAGAGLMTFRGCSFQANTARDGGGLANDAGIVALSDCEFHENVAEYSGGGMDNDGRATLTRCLFTQNTASLGGALDNTASESMLTDCVFQDNVAQEAEWSGVGGGGVYVHAQVGPRRGGGGLVPELGPTFVRCHFLGNKAVGLRGGGLGNYVCSPTLVNCLFAGNAATEGGAVYSYAANPTLTYCTVAQNEADRWPGISDEDATTILDHCIVWGHEGRGAGMSQSVRAAYSAIEGGWPGAGNIEADPLFASLGHWGTSRTRENQADGPWINGDYHLQSQAGRWDPTTEAWVLDEVTSPCIDTGDPSAPIGDEPFPNGGIANMGAYGGTTQASKSYFDGAPCQRHMAGDINGDCKVDLADLLVVILQWTEAEAEGVPPYFRR